MNKWLKLGGALLLLAWGPFLYAELTSDPAEKKGRDLPAEQPGQEGLVDQAAEDPEAPSAGEGAPAPAPPAAEAPAQPAEPSQPVEPDPPEPAVAAAPTAVAVPTQPEPVALQIVADPAPDTPAAEGAEAIPDEPIPPPVASGPTMILKHAFDTQPRDPLWAADAETRIRALFGTEELPKEMFKTATCRKSVCRVELQWSDEHAAAYNLLQKAVLDTFAGGLGVAPYGAPDAKGLLQVDLYLPRKGYTVADLAR